MKALLKLGLVTLGLAVATAPSADAFSYLESVYGTQELGLSARSKAMGGTGAAVGQGVYSLVDNPAAMLLARGSRVQGLGVLARASENRFVPIFDTFDSFVDEAATAVNDDGYGALQGGVVLDRWGEKGVMVSAGIFNRYDPRYDFFNEIRTSQNTDEIIANQFIEVSGVIRSATVGAAWAPDANFGVGAAVNYYYGTVDTYNATIGRPDSNVDTETSRSERKMDGVSVTLGGTARVDDRLQVGLSIETAPNLTDDRTVYANGDPVDLADLENGDVELPFRAQGGIAYRPRNTLKTTFAADVVYTAWEDVTDYANPDLALNDTWGVRFGIEHVFYNELGGRLGFRFEESYVDEEADLSAFSFGFGYIVDTLHLNLAGEVGKRNSRQQPLTPRDHLSPRVGLGTDRVEDTLVRVSLGASYYFD